MVNRTCSRVSLVLFALALVALASSATTIRIPLPAEMIAQSDLIVEGRLTIRVDTVELEIDEVIKGSAGKWKRLKLTYEHSNLDFNLSQVLYQRGSDSVMVLGRLDDRTGTLILPWLDGSIWPREMSSVVSAPVTLKSAHALVAGSARLEKAANAGPKELVSELIEGVEDPDRRILVLSFLDVQLDEYLAEREQRRALLLVIGGQLLKLRPMDAETVDSVARISPMLPPSVALDYLMEAAHSEEPRIAQTAYARVRSVLRARELIERDEAHEIDDLATMEGIVARELPGLRVEDAQEALLLFDSPQLEVRARASDVVASILGEEVPHAAPLNLVDARAFWRTKIHQISLDLSKQEKKYIER